MKRIGNALIWAAAFVVGVIALSVVGPRIETKIFPVADRTSTVVIERSPTSLQLVISGHKVRECQFNGASARVSRNGKWFPAVIKFMKKQDGKEDRTPRQFLEDRQNKPTALDESFIDVISVSPPGDTVDIQLYHNCHPMWQTITKIQKSVKDEPADSAAANL